MKKLLLTALIASLLVIPFGGTALALHEEASAPKQALDYSPGDVPAQTGVVEAMSPALHALVLAMDHQGAATFDRSNRELAWESLYNFLSLYGQMDRRVELEDDMLYLPEETAQDYAAALDLNPDEMGTLPAEILDRLSYDNVSRCYEVTPGEDGLSQIQVRNIQTSSSGLQLTGALIYTPSGRDLVRFQATLQLRDNMFGYSLTEMTLTN